MSDSHSSEHSIKRHPLREAMTVEEFAKLAKDVQFCRCSWPVGLEVGEDE